MTIASIIEEHTRQMHDSRVDGYTGFYCKQKIYQIYWQTKKALENAPRFHGEEEWIEEQGEINEFGEESSTSSD